MAKNVLSRSKLEYRRAMPSAIELTRNCTWFTRACQLTVNVIGDPEVLDVEGAEQRDRDVDEHELLEEDEVQGENAEADVGGRR